MVYVEVCLYVEVFDEPHVETFQLVWRHRDIIESFSLDGTGRQFAFSMGHRPSRAENLLDTNLLCTMELNSHMVFVEQPRWR